MKQYLNRLCELCDMFGFILENKEYVPTVGNFTKKEIMYLEGTGGIFSKEKLKEDEYYKEILEMIDKGDGETLDFDKVYKHLLKFKNKLCEEINLRSKTEEKIRIEKQVVEMVRRKLMENAVKECFNIVFGVEIFTDVIKIKSKEELKALFDRYFVLSHFVDDTAELGKYNEGEKFVKENNLPKLPAQFVENIASYI